jgi:hypothetical protein
MDFLHSPISDTLDQRTSRDICREACAIERPAPAAGGHRWIVPACLIAAAAAGVLLWLS